MKLQHSVDPVDAWYDKARKVWMTRMGQVGELDSTWHPSLESGSASATGEVWVPCIHVENPAPPMMLFACDTVESFTETPEPCLDPHWPAYCSRVGDLVTLSVDHVGGWDGPPGTWTWRMLPLLWIDLPDNGIEDLVWLGVWPD